MEAPLQMGFYAEVEMATMEVIARSTRQGYLLTTITATVTGAIVLNCKVRSVVILITMLTTAVVCIHQEEYPL